MADLLAILFSTVLVNNFVLVKFLGLCPFMGVSTQAGVRHRHGAGHHLRADAVLGPVACTRRHLAAVPLDLEYLRTIAFILVIAAVVQFTEMVVRKRSPLLYQVLGIFLPLITTNCAVLGVALLNVQENHDLPAPSLCTASAPRVGFSLVLVLFAACASGSPSADVPIAFRGAPIALVTAGLMSLAFMGFAGMIEALTA